MTLSGTSAAVVVTGLVVLGIAILATLPRWLFRPIIQCRVWALRDEFMDRVISGELPWSDPGVAYTAALFHMPDHHLADFRMSDFLSFNLVIHDPDARKALEQTHDPFTTISPNPQIAATLEDYVDRMSTLIFVNVVVGTWIGMVVIVTSPLWASILAFGRSRKTKPSRYGRRFRRSTPTYLAARQKEEGHRDRDLVPG